MPTGPALPVYLIHWDAPEWCASAVRSVLASEGVEIAVSVVDNGQLPGTTPALSELLPPGVQVLAMGENRGYAGAANAAVDDWRRWHPEAELAVIGSHDLHVGPETLARLVAVAEVRPRSGVVAPVLVAPRRVAGGAWNGRNSWQLPIPECADPVDRQWASGTCVLLRRACVDEVGAFDERLGSYMEDVDYGLRANDKGWKVTVVPGAEAWGLGSQSGRAAAHVAENSILLAAKRGGARGAAAGIAVFGYWAAKGYVAAAAPWRPRESRQRSLLDARLRAEAVALVTRRGALRKVLRDRASLA